MNTEELIKQIYKENNIWYEWYCTNDNNVEITVEFGDWKHDHGFIDHLMRENGFDKIGEDVTFDDGTDAYSSIHYYHLHCL